MFQLMYLLFLADDSLDAELGGDESTPDVQSYCADSVCLFRLGQVDLQQVHEDQLGLGSVKLVVGAQAIELRMRHHIQPSVLPFEVLFELSAEVIVFQDKHPQKGSETDLRLCDLLLQLSGEDVVPELVDGGIEE